MIKRVVNAVRRNHALEHATVSILLSRHGPHTRVLGRAAADGFYIYGDIPTEALEEFAHEGLARLQRGESHLAVAGLMAGLASLFAMGRRSRLEGLPGALMAAMVAVLAAQPLGRLVQKHVTTSPELDGVRIVSVEPVAKRFPRLHKVRTAPIQG